MKKKISKWLEKIIFKINNISQLFNKLVLDRLNKILMYKIFKKHNIKDYKMI